MIRPSTHAPNFLCRLLLGAFLLLVPACSGGGDSAGGDPATLVKAGNQALGKKDWPTAMSKFGAATTALASDPNSSLALEARIGRLEATAHLAPQSVQTELVALIDEGKLGFADLSMVVTALVGSRHFEEAISVLEAVKAKGAFADKIDQLVTAAGDAAAKAGDSSALEGLKGLGYAGGSK